MAWRVAQTNDNRQINSSAQAIVARQWRSSSAHGGGGGVKPAAAQTQT